VGTSRSSDDVAKEGHLQTVGIIQATTISGHKGSRWKVKYFLSGTPQKNHSTNKVIHPKYYKHLKEDAQHSHLDR
jgi:hypothetical protein